MNNLIQPNDKSSSGQHNKQVPQPISLEHLEKTESQELPQEFNDINDEKDKPQSSILVHFESYSKLFSDKDIIVKLYILLIFFKKITLFFSKCKVNKNLKYIKKIFQKRNCKLKKTFYKKLLLRLLLKKFRYLLKKIRCLLKKITIQLKKMKIQKSCLLQFPNTNLKVLQIMFRTTKLLPFLKIKQYFPIQKLNRIKNRFEAMKIL
ncbi:hypothetical protein TTHERM_00266529 (macronuclear) [Tetrahymena thermophila SB210]|uniref:Uncharacterized protein n=1 Tax=Tetrahymena thermophila (strain SB210) TaxID=312017 RepID=A4VDX1_TETTS|nr:hypothetical protein TTHERM_00266529 [Tetrahymena thermophila SB210]EDK31721.2 hypothetical protein TTHERM_00266529 [Tetrahymena thermophila SB210]|eukprot:XP_001470785.2 hypothetical protein TTHERM_00266529 [Tetrahymena thermophila SB210]